MSGTDAQTLAVYAEKAADYSEIHHGSATANRLAGFIAALPAGGTALDLGCGPGWGAAAMREAGLVVTAMDASPEMADVARDRYGLTVTVATFDALTAKDAFDGIWAHYSLLHAPRTALPRHLSAIRNALRPGGLFAVTMKLGEGEGRDLLGRFYTYVSVSDQRGLVTQAGLTVLSEEVFPSMGFDGTPTDCVYMTATRG
ncbi:Methyltransferase [Rhodovulum sp. P5]|uniref:class I SAM-dependent methyltransferase n=1 Tax=Rhodovulum sp. P5 TaxID=1564506 RepID=UPI0009C33A4B|nr:class I SAM-dependent methyltransferase [Rhodovulum sp. P5]ARE41008.1 Methyltransferase [Rhodovulum sp. P5]